MKHDQDLITLKSDKLRYYDDIRGDTDKQTSPYDVPGEAHLQELPGGAAGADEQCEGEKRCCQTKFIIHLPDNIAERNIRVIRFDSIHRNCHFAAISGPRNC